MKIIIFLLFTVVPGHATALCMATTSTLFKLEVQMCKDVSFSGDKRNPRSSSPKATIRGTLIGGKVLKSQSVLRYPDPDYPVFPGPYLGGDYPATVFMAADSAKVCSGLTTPEPVWLVATQLCCDVIPKQGLCLVPDSIPIVEKTRPEQWHQYKPLPLP